MMTELSSELPKWLELEEGYEARFNPPMLHVWNRETPERHFSFSTAGQRKAAESFYTAFSKFKEAEEKYLKLLDALEKEHGFTLTRGGDAGLVLTQRDYGITESIPADGSVDAMARVKAIRDAADEKCLEFEASLDLLRQRGFQETTAETRGDVTTKTYVHSDLPAPITVRLYGDLGRLDKESVTAIQRAVKDIDAPKPKSRKPSSAVLGKYKATLVFDASTLNFLAADIKRNKTWLDLVSISTGHPGVSDVLIPAIVADWELRGQITYLDRNGKLVTYQADKEFLDKTHPKAKLKDQCDGLLQEADRVQIFERPHVQRQVVAGTNPHLVICETAIDREFMREAGKICQDTSLTDAERVSRIREIGVQVAKEYLDQEGCDLGEISVLSSAHAWNTSGPAYVISNDIRFLRACPTELETRNAMPIGEATLRGYLRAEFDSRGKDLATTFSDRLPAGADQATPESIELDINRHTGQGERLNRGHTDEKPGSFMDDLGREQKGPRLSEVLAAATLSGGSIAHLLPGYQPRSPEHIVASHVAAVGEYRAPNKDREYNKTRRSPAAKSHMPEINEKRAELAALIVNSRGDRLGIPEIVERTGAKIGQLKQLLGDNGRVLPKLTPDEIRGLGKRIALLLRNEDRGGDHIEKFNSKLEEVILVISRVREEVQAGEGLS